jgi:hypothetical protein
LLEFGWTYNEDGEIIWDGVRLDSISRLEHYATDTDEFEGKFINLETGIDGEGDRVSSTYTEFLFPILKDGPKARSGRCTIETKKDFFVFLTTWPCSDKDKEKARKIIYGTETT